MSSFGDSRRSDETTRGPSTVGRGGPGSCRRVTHQSVRFCETRDGVRIAYATSGHGPPLVRVATWLTTLELDWECAVCRPWLSELSLEHTLVRFDPRMRWQLLIKRDEMRPSFICVHGCAPPSAERRSLCCTTRTRSSTMSATYPRELTTRRCDPFARPVLLALGEPLRPVSARPKTS